MPSVNSMLWVNSVTDGIVGLRRASRDMDVRVSCVGDTLTQTRRQAHGKAFLPISVRLGSHSLRTEPASTYEQVRFMHSLSLRANEHAVESILASRGKSFHNNSAQFSVFLGCLSRIKIKHFLNKIKY